MIKNKELKIIRSYKIKDNNLVYSFYIFTIKYFNYFVIWYNLNIILINNK